MLPRDVTQPPKCVHHLTIHKNLCAASIWYLYSLVKTTAAGRKVKMLNKSKPRNQDMTPNQMKSLLSFFQFSSISVHSPVIWSHTSSGSGQAKLSPLQPL